MYVIPPNKTLRDTPLRYVILNDQLRTIRACATAVELQIVCKVVIVVIFREAQAKLRQADLVDFSKGCGQNICAVPIRRWRVAKRSGQQFAVGGIVEIEVA